MAADSHQANTIASRGLIRSMPREGPVHRITLSVGSIRVPAKPVAGGAKGTWMHSSRCPHQNQGVPPQPAIRIIWPDWSTVNLHLPAACAFF